MGRFATWTFVAVLSVALLGPACATPGRMVVAGCHPLVAGSDGPGLFVADPEGYNAVRLLTSNTMYVDPWCILNPDWSPDGERLVFQYGCALAVYDLDVLLRNSWDFFRTPDMSEECCPLVASLNFAPVRIHGCGQRPKWSPDGDRIAFSDGSVCVINPDGTSYASLAPGGWDGVAWTADGLGIVFASATNLLDSNSMYDPLRADLYLVTDLENPGGTTITQLTNTPTVAEHRPEVSPYGLRLAYSSGPAVSPDWDWATDPLPPAGVRVASYPSLSGELVLTNDSTYHDYVDAWSPDGQYVYFEREYAGAADTRPVSRTLWRVKADGSAAEEQVPGLADWEAVRGGVSFMKKGVYGTSVYALPGYTNIPLTIGVLGIENLAGLQAKLAFDLPPGEWECCRMIETMDTCGKGAMIDHWSLVGPEIDQLAGKLDVLAYAGNPELDRVSGAGELLELEATTPVTPDAWFLGGVSRPVDFDQLDLGDDWGDPISMAAIPGGIAFKPFSYLELSEVPPLIMGDDEAPVPISLSITARGDVDEVFDTAETVRFYLETNTTDEWGRTYTWAYDDAITPTSAQLADGAWSGDIVVLRDAQEGSRILAKSGDFGGLSNSFDVVGKGDVSGDDSIDVFDVVKIANMAIGRGTWADWQWWAADLNNDGEVDVFDVIICAGQAVSEMETSGIGRAAVLAAPGPSVAAVPDLVTVSDSTTREGGQTFLHILLSDTSALSGIQVAVSYDPDRLAYRAVWPGSVLGGAPDWIVMGNDLGGVVKAIGYSPGLTALAGGEGAVLTLVFDEVGKKKGKPEVTSVKLSTAQGSEIQSAIGKGAGEGKGKKK